MHLAASKPSKRQSTVERPSMWLLDGDANEFAIMTIQRPPC